MKKIYFLLVVAVLSFTSCHNDIWNSINDLDSRVKALEELCREMNTNISSLQALIEVIQSGDYITNIVPITKGGEVIGYTIMFKNHEPITIYNGEDGVTANTPIIGAAQDTDGVYYWTVNGEWLLDDNGNKIRVTGRDGQNGQDGQDGNDGQPGQPGQPGNNGQNGQNGADGITPTLKIENGMWYVSYDNGSTWTMLGQATGDPGQPGQPGQNGQDGESIFANITYDANSVVFTLSDGTTITVPRDNGTGGTIPTVPIIDGAIMAPFSVSDSTQIYFSQGHLQYSTTGTHLCADGTTKKGTWKFASHQYYNINFTIRPQDSTVQGWIELFMVGSSGYSLQPYVCVSSSTTQNVSGTYHDWGVYNAISNGGNQPNIWRTLTYEEANYLIFYRDDAPALRNICKVGDVKGLLLLPDNWSVDNLNPYKDDYNYIELKQLELTGAVFMPICTTYKYSSSSFSNYLIDLTCTILGTNNGNNSSFGYVRAEYVLNTGNNINYGTVIKSYGVNIQSLSYAPVRLVKDVPQNSN